MKSDFFPVNGDGDIAALKTWLQGRRYNAATPGKDKHGKNIIGLKWRQGRGQVERRGVVWVNPKTDFDYVFHLVEAGAESSVLPFHGSIHA